MSRGDDVVWAGTVFDGTDLFHGYVRHDGRTIVEIDEGAPSQAPDAEGLILPAPVNAHTHLGDTSMRGVVDVPSDLAAAVAPPDGAKHRYLRSASAAELEAGLRRGLEEASRAGTDLVADFREGGIAGIGAIERAAPAGGGTEPMAFARSADIEPEPGELDAVLERAAGLGLSGVNDVPPSVRDEYADACRRAGKPLGLHLSEVEREDVQIALSLEPAFVVHVCEATRSDLEALADAGVGVVLCPRSNALFGRRAPIDRVLDVGVEFALGTDNGWFHAPDVWSEAAFLLDRWPRTPPRAVMHALCSSGRKVLKIPGNVPRLEEGLPLRAVVLKDAAERGPGAALRGGHVVTSVLA